MVRQGLTMRASLLLPPVLPPVSRQTRGRAALDRGEPRVDAGRPGGDGGAAALGRRGQAEADAVVGLQPGDLLRDDGDRFLFRRGEGVCVCVCVCLVMCFS